MTKRKQAAASRRRTAAVEGFRSAAETIGAIEHGKSLFAITRGQFSMIDVIRHCVASMCEDDGPRSVSVWTWCIADYEVEAFEWFLQTKELASATLVIDRSAEQRNAELIDRWRLAYGEESVRVCSNHAKIATIANDSFRILARGSMNLNFNPRFEQLDLTEGGEDFELVREIEEDLPVLAPMCSANEARHASKLSFAFSDEELKPFGGFKPWAK